MSRAPEFGKVRFDPGSEKANPAYNEKAAVDYNRNDSVAVGQTEKRRKSSVFDRARNSATTLRGSLSKDPGWDKHSNPLRSSSAGVDGDNTGEEIDYNTLEWWQAGFIMIAETVSLGILALPSTLAKVGMVPGIILIVGLGILATYSGYVIGQFHLRYPWVHSFGDAGEILGAPINMGRFFKELFGWSQVLFLVFTMASHILIWTICLNTLTNSATCTIVWGIIGLGIFWFLDLPRTLKNVSYMSIASFLSILTAVFTTMIGVAVQKPIGNGHLSATRVLGFTEAFLSVSNITFAYAGHSCFFGFISEFKNPAEWPKALAMLQIFDTSLYIVAAIVIYVYTGPDVKSPALGSTGPVLRKVAWGLAIPTIIIAGVIYGHVASKYVFVRLFRGTKHMTKKTKLSTMSWLIITGSGWIIAWIIAESIPDFTDLLGLVSSLFASWFTYGIPGVFWLFLNWGGDIDETGHVPEEESIEAVRAQPRIHTHAGIKGWFRTWKKACLVPLNFMLFTIGLAACVLGLWSSGEAIGKAAGGGGSWTCKSNAQ